MYSCSLFDHSNECPTNHPSTPITNMSRLNEVTHVRTREGFILYSSYQTKMCLCIYRDAKNDTISSPDDAHKSSKAQSYVFANIVDASGCKYFLSANSMVQWYNRRDLIPFAQSILVCHFCDMPMFNLPNPSPICLAHLQVWRLGRYHRPAVPHMWVVPVATGSMFIIQTIDLVLGHII